MTGIEEDTETLEPARPRLELGQSQTNSNFGLGNEPGGRWGGGGAHAGRGREARGREGVLGEECEGDRERRSRLTWSAGRARTGTDTGVSPPAQLNTAVSEVRRGGGQGSYLLQERHDSPHVRGELRLTCSLSGKDTSQSRMELPTSSIVTSQVGATGRHGVTPRADMVKATLEMDSTSTQLQVDRSSRRQSTD